MRYFFGFIASAFFFAAFPMICFSAVILVDNGGNYTSGTITVPVSSYNNDAIHFSDTNLATSKLFWTERNKISPSSVPVSSVVTRNNSVFAMTYNGLYISKDGNSFVKNGFAFPRSSLLAINESALFVYDPDSRSKTNMWWSIDNGSTWTPSFAEPQSSFFACKKNVFTGSGSGISRWTDNQKTWTKVFNGLNNDTIKLFGADGENVYAASDSALFVSIDDGLTWKASNFKAQAIYSLAARGDTVFAATTTGVVRSIDKGTTWENFWFGGLPRTLQSLLICGNYIYADCGIPGVFRSKTSHLTWQPVNRGLPPGKRLLTSGGTEPFVVSVQYGNGIYILNNRSISLIFGIGSLVCPCTHQTLNYRVAVENGSFFKTGFNYLPTSKRSFFRFYSPNSYVSDSIPLFINNDTNWTTATSFPDTLGTLERVLLCSQSQTVCDTGYGKWLFSETTSSSPRPPYSARYLTPHNYNTLFYASSPNCKMKFQIAQINSTDGHANQLVVRWMTDSLGNGVFYDRQSVKTLNPLKRIPATHNKNIGKCFSNDRTVQGAQDFFNLRGERIKVIDLKRMNGLIVYKKR